MISFTSLHELRQQTSDWKKKALRIGFVPTMGNLHAGHFALIELAREHSDIVVSSIFVNPTQFGPNEDYARYPRTEQSDLDGLENAGCDAVFLPTADVMYPFGSKNYVQMHVPGITDILCGAHRPGHFNGVATVVARLFNMVQPDIAVFGRKDYQQLQVIRYMTREMSFPVEIIPAPTLREESGLAMSSRNQYLSTEERVTAAEIYRTLQMMRDSYLQGLAAEQIEQKAYERLQSFGFDVDYAELRSAELGSLARAQSSKRVALIAARLGLTRLIDNIEFDSH
jgi:pantoate--beta-alanine ligase